MVMPLGDNTAGDARYAFSHVHSLLAPGYGAPAGRAASTEQNEVMREGNAGMHAATMSTTSTQRASMPRLGSALMTNGLTVNAQFSAYQEGLFTQMQGRDGLAAAGGSPTRGERFHARWDSSLDSNNNIGGSRPTTLDTGSSDVAQLRGYVVTPISIGSLTEATPFAIPSSYVTSPVVARERVPAATTTTTTTTGSMMMSSSANSFQHHVKFDSPLTSRFESTRGGPIRPSGLVVPPYSLDNVSQAHNEEKIGVTNNETYSSLMSYGGTTPPSYHVDPCMHAIFPYCRQMPQNAIYSTTPRNTVNTTIPVSNVLHTGSFSAGRGLSAPYHNTGMAPPPLSYHEQTQHQPRPYPRETAAEASDHASNPPMRRTRRRQESTFWELFERLAYRPSGQNRRSATNTGTQRRTGQGYEGGNHPFGGWLRHSRRVAEYTQPIVPSFSPVRPRPGTPPPPQTLSREAQGSRITLRFSSNHRPSRLSEMYLFEAAFAPDVDNMSYEELLELAERIGRVECGVSRERLQQLRVVLQPIHFGVTSPRQEKMGTARGSVPSPQDVQRSLHAHEEESLTCCVCLDSFSVGNVATQLPCCRHFLHEDCSSRWFESQFRCPICTRDVRET
ncbi:hypothetical protein MOQ_006564 [Trypanosoma cruzi marinkellei]|uniref:RING-type E3 ubiquitin transferase n=1 Tax=Trypanosoma cruzi marinkellei TaxID=85056 RepID=K2MRH6_TRYCR|nr:hypothetical protein MOQ_006564 [Trypanosoma cruzi marinkellei]